MRPQEHPSFRTDGSFDAERALRKRLAEDRLVDDTTLFVTVDRAGKATLAGEVPDRETFEHVHAIVARARGVNEIDNVLTIAGRKQAKDHEIALELQRKLADDFPTSHIEVALVGSTAVLEGTTVHEAERAEIERMVQGHARVDRTVNHIRVV